ncbi:AcrR family transcriptional regulator [Mycobacterium sp. OAS707]|uniref:TetR/AcrR family transcriptional regulator n=1 Tax=Mycobacterium sp. OAS707 TaxID=2663822 RepID=UPI00178C141D|nr:TetR/AcrR family transcriptional regulator [Mycobacterium sp. OAS707]MBE1548566.1 AcrR family transcriptional regulator [Mycobacterium sp. OAS707]
MPPHPTATRLLQTALLMIDSDGPDALTVRSLVEQSGVTVGSIYHHLGSLDQLRGAVADEALRSWSTDFLAALRERGYAAAAAADRAWSRAHPGLGVLIETTGRLGEMGDAAERFNTELRGWLDSEQLAKGAPAHLVAAIILGPLLELRRLERATGHAVSNAELEVLEKSVLAALAVLESP